MVAGVAQTDRETGGTYEGPRPYRPAKQPRQPPTLLGHEFWAFTGLTPTRYVEVRRRFLREHPGHALDSWPLPAD